jgi:hypothetical protein
MVMKRKVTKRKPTTKRKIVRQKSSKSKVRKCPTCGGLARVSIKRKAKGKWDDATEKAMKRHEKLEEKRQRAETSAEIKYGQALQREEFREYREQKKWDKEQDRARAREAREAVGRRYREGHPTKDDY